MELSRREAVQKILGGSASLLLRSLATGLPPAFLLDPTSAKAASSPARAPQFLVLSTSVNGEPMNANVPGCYLDAGVAHSAAPEMAPTVLRLDGTAHTAALPWASLPQDVLDRSLFLHHATNTSIHPDEPRVLGLMGAIAQGGNLPSLLASELQQPLGCIQAAPIALGAFNAGEFIPFNGRTQSPLHPQSLAAVLGNPTGPLSALQATRDKALTEIVAWMKAGGNATQKAFLDRYVTSQAQVRQLSESLLGQLEAIPDNAVDSQFAAAIVLAQMKLSPVLTVHLDFGGDNHGDPDLTNETRAHVKALASLNKFFAGLKAAKMQDKVTFATLNVFGRTLGARGTTGRDHLSAHHVTYAAGVNVRAGVYGGLSKTSRDFGAMPIDSRSGRASADGDVTRDLHLGTVGRTLAALVGVDETSVAAKITSGVTLAAAVV